jgi:hypothetical protein
MAVGLLNGLLIAGVTMWCAVHLLAHRQRLPSNTCSVVCLDTEAIGWAANAPIYD